MSNQKSDQPYVITGVMDDGAPYSAEGAAQPDGSVLFQVPHHARVKGSCIVAVDNAPTPNQYIIEKAAQASPF